MEFEFAIPWPASQVKTPSAQVRGDGSSGGASSASEVLHQLALLRGEEGVQVLTQAATIEACKAGVPRWPHDCTLLKTRAG
jgi:hypothetical protein